MNVTAASKCTACTLNKSIGGGGGIVEKITLEAYLHRSFNLNKNKICPTSGKTSV